MNQLTLEQIKTLEDAFAGLPKEYKDKGKYRSMEGIQEQIEELDGKPGLIFYISEMNMKDNGELHCVMEKMKIE